MTLQREQDSPTAQASEDKRQRGSQVRLAPAK